jgi:hypothetical protein
MLNFDTNSDRIADLLIDLLNVELELNEALATCERGEDYIYFYGVEVDRLDTEAHYVRKALQKLGCFEFMDWKLF